MKRFKFIMTALFGLLLFATLGAVGSTVDIGAFMDAPILYFADNLSDSFVSMATMTFSASPLNWEDGTENMGGFRDYLYVIPISDITSEAELPANPTSDAEAVTLAGNHTLAAGKYFKKVYATPGTVGYTPENQGEVDGQSFKVKGSFLHPGSSDAVNALARFVNNGNFIIILVEEDGRRVQVGQKGHPARIKPAPNFGMAAADRKGFNFEFEADSFVAALRYNGEIPLSESDTEPAIS